MLSRRLLVNHRIYDHVDEEPKHHVHEEELKKQSNLNNERQRNNFFLPISTSLTCNVSFNWVIYSKSSAM